jgi:hypothetical protein
MINGDFKKLKINRYYIYRMNRIHPESIIYLKNDQTHNKLIKIQVFEKSVKICQIKKYFGKYETECYPKYFNYKINIYNDYDINHILVDYEYYVFTAKPKFISRKLNIFEKGLAVTFFMGVLIILILI